MTSVEQRAEEAMSQVEQFDVLIQDRRPQGARYPHQRIEPRACRNSRPLQSDNG
jgi:hypothetical protein